MQIGPYEVLDELGRGGMGTVFRARRPDLDRDFALKLIRPGTGLSPVQIARFQREARAAGALSGTPGIVSVHDIGVTDDGTLYLAMDRIDGRPLDAIVADEPLPPRNVAITGAAIARAVQAAHDRGVLHRDIKPANVLVGKDGTPYLADFGLAAAEQLDQNATKLTKSGEIFGTAAYMPPEQARGEPLDVTADVYSLGATLFEMAVGGPPFARDSTFATLMEVLQGKIPLARLRAAGVPADLVTIIGTCLAKSPADRYPTALALAEELDRFARGEAILARPEGALATAWRVVRRRRGAVAAAAAAVALAGAGLWWAGRAERSADDAAGSADSAAQESAKEDFAQALVGAWSVLDREAGPEVRLCEDAFYGVAVPPERLRAARARIEQVADELRGEGMGLADAWAGYTQVLAEDPQAGFDRIAAAAEAAPLDPVPPLLAARAALAVWVKQLPGVVLTVRMTGVEVQRVQETREGATWRRRAERALQHAATSELWDRLGLTEEVAAYQRGVNALAQEQYGAAVEALAVLHDTPLFQQESLLLAGAARLITGDFEAAAATLERAAQRRWPDAAMRAGQAWQGAAGTNWGTPRRAAEQLGRAAAAYRAAAAERADAAFTALREAQALRLRTEIRTRLGENDAESLAQALQALARGLAAAESNPRPVRVAALRAERASVHVAEARRCVAFGEDPTPALHAAIPDAEAAAAATPDLPARWITLGLVRADLGDAAAGRGRPALPQFDAALEALDRATLCPGAHAVAWFHRGEVRLRRSRAVAARGTSPLPDLERSLADLDTALGKQPNFAEALLNRAIVRWSMAELAGPQRADTLLTDGITDATHAIGLRAEDSNAYRTRAGLYEVRSRFRASTGRDPVPDERAAIADLDRAVELNTANGGAFVARANIYTTRGERAAAGGGDPRADFSRAVADYQAALQATPGDLDARYNLALCHLSIGDAARAQGEDPVPHYETSVAVFAAACRAAPGRWDLQAGYGSALLMLNRLPEALDAFEAALRANPSHAAIRRQVEALRAAIKRK